jgi:hypothetical protein
MQVNIRKIDSELGLLANSLGFRRSNDPRVYYSPEAKDLILLLELTYNNFECRIGFGIRPDVTLRGLAKCLSAELPGFVPNPFLEKWCTIGRFPISPPFSIESPENLLSEVLSYVKNDVQVIRKQAKEVNLGYWTDIAWKAKQFDGLSRYVLPFLYLHLGRLEASRNAVRYFSMLEFSSLKDYHRKASRIFDWFNIDPDPRDTWRTAPPNYGD